MNPADNNLQSHYKTVLAIDDDPDFLIVLKSILKKIIPNAEFIEYVSTKMGRPDESFDWLKYDLILLDYDLGNDEKGLDWLRHYKRSEDFPTTIMLTAHGDEEIAVQAIRFGAHDYINKCKLSVDRIAQALTNAIDRKIKQTQLATTLTLQTTLFNKISFYRKLRDKLNTKDKETDNHSFIIQVNIDDYEKLHKKYGLLTIDELVSNMAQNIAECITGKDFDVNITITGDSVIACLLTEHSDANGGEQVAKTICKLNKSYSFSYKDVVLKSSISIGVVSISGTEQNPDKLLGTVDQACQQASKEPGDSFFLYGEPSKKPKGVKKKVKKQVGVEQSASNKLNLADVMKQNRLQPYYQPFMALSEGAGTFVADYYQLKFNIIDLNGKSISQDALDQSELEPGSLALLDRGMLRYGLGQLAAQKKKKKEHECGLFLRISNESFASNILYAWMTKLIVKTKTSSIASKLVFEITPSEFLANEKVIDSFINKMRRTWGIAFALCDITNPSMLEFCMKKTGFEFVKILTTTVKSDAIPDITSKARELGALTVLENINNGNQLNDAIAAEVDYGQGDFIQPPQDQLVTRTDDIEI